MHRLAFILGQILCLTATALLGQDVSKTSPAADCARAMTDAFREGDVHGHAFDVTATVTYVCTNRFDEKTDIALSDDTGAAFCSAEKREWPDKTIPTPGSKARLQGYFETNANGLRFAVLTNCTELSKGPPPKCEHLILSQLQRGTNFFRLCERTGSLRDVAHDETDPHMLVLHLHSLSGQSIATVPVSSERDYAFLCGHIGRQITAPGIFVPYDRSAHSPFGCKFQIAAIDQIKIDKFMPPDKDLSDQIRNYRGWQPSEITSLGRHFISGWIVARWQRNCALLRTESGFHLLVKFADGSETPPCGEYGRVTGLPTSDLFTVTMLQATWTKTNGPPLADECATPVSIRALVSDESGAPRIDSRFLGHAVSVTGIVRRIESEDGSEGFLLESDGGKVTLDASATPALCRSLVSGSTIAVTGICLLRTSSSSPSSLIPRLNGLCIVPRASSDVKVIRLPSWWETFPWRPAFAVLMILFLAIVGWNFSLRRLAEKRGRDLAGASLARAVSDLKVYERTRLAVELHDSLAQTLTGIALELDTAELAEGDTAKMRQHLGTAARALKSCRAELRNCLWDLRNETLEDGNLEAAVLKTLEPHTRNVRLSVRFAVPRERVTDNSAHAILRIIRELTVNAIRHGKATSIRVAGAIEGDTLKFSVMDNGCGFDPAHCPGDEQGHYGLLGIRERINTLEGRLNIDSTIGTGTKVTISITMPRVERHEGE